MHTYRSLTSVMMNINNNFMPASRYAGSKISLITTSDVRYEGVLCTLDSHENALSVQSVRSFGTEGRKLPEIPKSNEIYDSILFRNKDLKLVTVLENDEKILEFAIQDLQGSFSPLTRAPSETDCSDASSSAPSSESAFMFGSLGTSFGRPINHRNIQPHHPASHMMYSHMDSETVGTSLGSSKSIIRKMEAQGPSRKLDANARDYVPMNYYDSSVSSYSPFETQNLFAPNASSSDNWVVSSSQKECQPSKPSSSPWGPFAISPLDQPPWVDKESSCSSTQISLGNSLWQKRPRKEEERPRRNGSSSLRKETKTKTIADVFALHSQAEDILTTLVRSRGHPSLNSRELRQLAEVHPCVYHFFLDFVNYCRPGSSASSDEQHWDLCSRALKKHFEGEHERKEDTSRGFTLGDFTTIKKKAQRKSPKCEDKKSIRKDPCEKEANWSCPRCTLQNGEGTQNCGACGTTRDYAAFVADFPPLA